MKRKSRDRLKSELWRKLLPEADLPTLANDIDEFLRNRVRKSEPNANVANNLAAYLILKYSVSNRKVGRLRWLIERHWNEFASFLEKVNFKKFRALAGMGDPAPQPGSLKEVVQALLKPPDQTHSPAIESAPTKRKRRPRPKTTAERTLRRKQSKDRYEERRRHYRRGLIVKEFGTVPFATFDPRLLPESQGSCLDILFNGKPVRMAGCAGSLEDLFGVDRHRFPKLRRPKGNGRGQVYKLDAFVQCLTHLLANRDGRQPWLPAGPQRDLVLRGIIERAVDTGPHLQTFQQKRFIRTSPKSRVFVFSSRQTS